jgi:osmotically-inducible protein OsmY
VRDGAVTLDGRLDRRSAVELAGRLAGQVSGVVRVTSTIAYDVDNSTLAERDAGRPVV